MDNKLHTYRVTFYRKGRVEIAIVEVRAFSQGVAYPPAVRYLEAHFPQSAAIVKTDGVGYMVEEVPE